MARQYSIGGSFAAFVNETTDDEFSFIVGYLNETAVAAQALTPSLFTNASSFFAPTVTPGAVALTPGLFTNSQTFFAPTLSTTDLPDYLDITLAGTFDIATGLSGTYDITTALQGTFDTTTALTGTMTG